MKEQKKDEHFSAICLQEKKYFQYCTGASTCEPIPHVQTPPMFLEGGGGVK